MIDFAALQTELLKEKYTGLDDEATAELVRQGEPIIGRIQGEMKLNLQAFIAKQDLIFRMEQVALETLPEGATAEQATLLTQKQALARALKANIEPTVVMSTLFRINLADPEVAGMFAGLQAFGLLTSTEIDTLNLMATHYVSQFPSASSRDVYVARNNLFAATESDMTIYQDGSSLLNVSATPKMVAVVSLENPRPYDVTLTFKVYVCKRDFDPNMWSSYVLDNRTFNVTVPAGETGVQQTIIHGISGRNIRVKYTPNMNIPMTVNLNRE